jgi:predicted HTH transcriptional regulator
MTAEEPEKIAARHEMQCLELKESFNIECIETACAFTNAHGGFIVIGVDNDGNPSKHQLRFEGLRDYENKVATATEPSVAVDAEKLEFGGHDVIVLRVMENPIKPVGYKGRCFIRKGSVNHQMTPSEIAECHLKSTGSSMDAVFVPDATKEDLDKADVANGATGPKTGPKTGPRTGGLARRLRVEEPACPPLQVRPRHDAARLAQDAGLVGATYAFLGANACRPATRLRHTS